MDSSIVGQNDANCPVEYDLLTLPERHVDKMLSALEPEIKTIGVESTPPDAERTKDAFSRIGYSLEESIADLIDNSIDAGATDVLIRLVYDQQKVSRIYIVDNGHGMGEEKLRKAMQFGATLAHDETDLGKYGIGLKSASLGQCEQFSVITRRGGKVSGRRWSAASFKKNWLCETLDPAGCSSLLKVRWAGMDLGKSGTIVMWENLTCLHVGDAGASEIINKSIISLANHLGLTFHRFIESKNGLRIHLESQLAGLPGSEVTQTVAPLNPFGYRISGAKDYPRKFQVRLQDVGALTLHAHIWPPKSRDRGYTLGGGKVSSRQGFYFYRNNRLIQSGGWNGYRGDDAEPHVSLARVAVDIPPGAEAHFDVMVQKSKVSPPRDFIEALKKAAAGPVRFSDYVLTAVEVYRQSSAAQASDGSPLVPWTGLSSDFKFKAKALLAPGIGSPRKVNFHWETLETSKVFDVDPHRNRIILNEVHRKSILGGSRRSKKDAELFKATIFLLVEGYFDRKPITGKRKEFLETCNSMLLLALHR